MLQTSFHKERHLCPYCSSEEEVVLWDIVLPSEDPDLRERLLQKNLQVLDCSNCGRHFVLDAPLLYRDQDRGFCLYVHSALSSLQQSRSMQDQVELLGLQIPPGAEADRLRICSSYNELIEKIHIFEDDLDDRIVECLKILRYFQYKWTWKRDIAESRFLGLEGDQLLFYERLQDSDSETGDDAEEEGERIFELDIGQYTGLKQQLAACVQGDSDRGWRCVSSSLGHEWLLTLDLFRDPGATSRH